MRKAVISLGGSVIVPDRYDLDFLKKFKNLVFSFSKYKFILICGGGKLARDFQKEGRKIKLDNKKLDWLGIYATRLNAYVIRKIFNLKEEIIVDPTKKIKNSKISIAAGWKPGFSTDYDAVLFAKNSKSGMVVNVTNVDYVYDKDPKKYKNAKPIKEISWKEFRKLLSTKWKPGLNAPFDPLAAKEAEKLKLRVFIIGKDLNNLKNLLDGKKFKGTVIK
ncbi:UMP kinase [Candidatus Woesearchaeota archaeon]|nr:UMP kinase [Candidatus Woesearchaeota archaeon]